MTQLEILQLALYGARKRISDTAYDYHRCCGKDDVALKRLKDSLKEYDEITELIENEMHSGVATKEESTCPT